MIIKKKANTHTHTHVTDLMSLTDDPDFKSNFFNLLDTIYCKHLVLMCRPLNISPYSRRVAPSKPKSTMKKSQMIESITTRISLFCDARSQTEFERLFTSYGIEDDNIKGNIKHYFNYSQETPSEQKRSLSKEREALNNTYNAFLNDSEDAEQSHTRYDWMFTNPKTDEFWKQSGLHHRMFQRLMVVVIKHFLDVLQTSCTGASGEPGIFGLMGWSDCKKGWYFDPKTKCCLKDTGVQVFNVQKLSTERINTLNLSEKELIENEATENIKLQKMMKTVEQGLTDEQSKCVWAIFKKTMKSISKMFKKFVGSWFGLEECSFDISIDEPEGSISLDIKNRVKGMFTTVLSTFKKLTSFFTTYTVVPVVQQVASIVKWVMSFSGVINKVLFFAHYVLEYTRDYIFSYLVDNKYIETLENFLEKSESFWGTDKFDKENKIVRHPIKHDVILCKGGKATGETFYDSDDDEDGDNTNPPLPSTQSNGGSNEREEIIPTSVLLHNEEFEGWFSTVTNGLNNLYNYLLNSLTELGETVKGFVETAAQFLWDKIKELGELLEHLQNAVANIAGTAAKSVFEATKGLLSSTNEFIVNNVLKLPTLTGGIISAEHIQNITGTTWNLSTSYAQHIGISRSIVGAISSIGVDPLLKYLDTAVAGILDSFSVYTMGLASVAKSVWQMWMDLGLKPMLKKMIHYLGYIVSALEIFDNLEMFFRFFSITQYIKTMQGYACLYPLLYNMCRYFDDKVWYINVSKHMRHKVPFFGGNRGRITKPRLPNIPESLTNTGNLGTTSQSTG